MITNHLENNWTYSAKLIKRLQESGYFNGILDVDTKCEELLKNLAKWSKVNYEIYGYYQLHEDQLNELLEDVSLAKEQLSEEGIQTLVDCELLEIEVSGDGHLAYRIPVSSDN